MRARPSVSISVVPPMPMRTWSGISKNRPGTTLVSYLSRRSWQRASMRPGTIRFQTPASVSGDFAQMIERDHAEQLRRVRGNDAEKIIEPPHTLGQGRGSEYPAAAQPGKAKSFRQAAGHDEIGAEMKCRARMRIETGIEIDFIDENLRAAALRDLANQVQARIRRARSAGIVKIGDGDQPGARRHVALDFARVNLETVLEAAREAAHFCAQVIRDGKQRLVGGLFDQHFVARFDERSHGKMIGHRRAIRSDHAFGSNAVLLRQALLERRVAVAARRGNFQVLDFRVQLRERIAIQAAGCQIEPGMRAQLGPLEIRRTNFPARCCHVWRLLFLFCALQKKYTGMPANRIPKPTAVSRGYLKIVLSTTNQDAATKRKVVTGWPGMRERPVGAVGTPAWRSRRRKTNRQVAVRPKNKKSIDTT